MENSLLTIYVSSPLAYRDVFNVFYKCFKRCWGDCTFPFVLSTNSSTDSFDDITVINSENECDSWVERSIFSLKKISTKYVLIMCDDIFISHKVNNDKIKEIVKFMDDNNMDFCRLKPTKKGKRKEKNILLLSSNVPYAKNLQIGIYNREFLLRELGEGKESAWDIENRWNKEALANSKRYYSNIIGVRKPVIHYYHGVFKGRWFPRVFKKLKKDGLLFDTGREVLSFKIASYEHIKGFFGCLFPLSLRYKIKKLLLKFGVHFTTES